MRYRFWWIRKSNSFVSYITDRKFRTILSGFRRTVPIQAGHMPPRLPGNFGMSVLQSALQITSPEKSKTTLLNVFVELIIIFYHIPGEIEATRPKQSLWQTNNSVQWNRGYPHFYTENYPKTKDFCMKKKPSGISYGFLSSFNIHISSIIEKVYKYYEIERSLGYLMGLNPQPRACKAVTFGPWSSRWNLFTNLVGDR